ncbi:cytochrome c biogenesis protein CcsA [Bacterioplanes sanyensis]|uniref:cytochrome-c peroxidase n=1 Tax=Bacterioplanes sanyensis TaxID=1249553 RepID=UPI001678733F|nr:cytochrome-c peroxidase [Bacterioplanes sanyensis]GGY55516.1 cytochrome c biogenesis protein CcsA [Bacterioplanes sanyensis]
MMKFALSAVLTLGAAMSQASGLIQPIEPYTSPTPAKVELGKMLFFDPRLSKSGFISCNSCHNLSMGGSDNMPTSIGHDWQLGPINSPTVLNSGFNIAQFWDGRAETLQEQAGGPIANPGEMASTHTLALDVLRSIPGYRQAFAEVYGKDSIDIDQVTDAIAEFERTLVTPDSPFDRYLRGDKNAISAQAKAGYELFQSTGCVACHNGPALGGTSFQKMGVVKAYETDSKIAGRSAVTGNEIDRFKFKVPTLRNVELTYPYFHDGAVWDLAEAVNLMAELQLGHEFKAEETEQMVAFLKSLTGKQPDFKLPILPPSTVETPRPNPN